MTDNSKYLIPIDQFSIIKPIEIGGFTEIFLVEDKEGQKYAAKIIKFEPDIDFDFDKTISFLGHFHHQTITNFIGYSPIDFNGENHLTIFTEYLPNQSLYNFLQNNSKTKIITNTDIQIILVGIARGMIFLHQNNRIHRDLKDTNVLIDNELHPRISGFTPIAYLEKDQKLSSKIGTPLFMAPEVIKGDYDFKADVYSFAILMFKVITGKKPIIENIEKNNYNIHKYYKQILKGFRPNIDVKINGRIEEMILKCWSEDPDERFTFDEIFNKLAFDKEYLLDGVDTEKLNAYVNSIK